MYSNSCYAFARLPIHTLGATATLVCQSRNQVQFYYLTGALETGTDEVNQAVNNQHLDAFISAQLDCGKIFTAVVFIQDAVSIA